MDESPTRSANSRRRQSIGRGQAPLSFDLRGEGDQDDRVGDVQRITDAWDMGVHDFSATKKIYTAQDRLGEAASAVRRCLNEQRLLSKRVRNVIAGAYHIPPRDLTEDEQQTVDRARKATEDAMRVYRVRKEAIARLKRSAKRANETVYFWEEDPARTTFSPQDDIYGELGLRTKAGSSSTASKSTMQSFTPGSSSAPLSARSTAPRSPIKPGESSPDRYKRKLSRFESTPIGQKTPTPAARISNPLPPALAHKSTAELTQIAAAADRYAALPQELRDVQEGESRTKHVYALDMELMAGPPPKKQRTTRSASASEPSAAAKGKRDQRQRAKESWTGFEVETDDDGIVTCTGPSSFDAVKDLKGLLEDVVPGWEKGKYETVLETSRQLLTDHALPHDTTWSKTPTEAKDKYYEGMKELPQFDEGIIRYRRLKRGGKGSNSAQMMIADMMANRQLNTLRATQGQTAGASSTPLLKTTTYFVGEAHLDDASDETLEGLGSMTGYLSAKIRRPDS